MTDFAVVLIIGGIVAVCASAILASIMLKMMDDGDE